MLDALVTAALIELARAGATHAGQAPPAGGLDRERVEALGALIGAHFREHRPVGFYADRLGVSAAHLNRIARRATGRSVSQLLTLRLVEEARRDLVFTFLPAQSIALSLGFSDPAYFSRFFRKQTGMTPGAFRERERARLKF
jgi:AraC family transcriptional activator of pobA